MRDVLLPASSLAHRELIRFLRQRSRVIGAFLTPVLFWLLIGAGMGRSFADPSGVSSGGYISFFFPGTVVMIVLFTAIFSTISIIEDRRDGFLQGVLVSPAPRGSIALGKIFGAATLAILQAGLFLLAAPLVGLRPGFAGVLLAIAILVVLSVALAGLGFVIAWRMTSTQGFHAIMNLLLMPMWFLSGALFPVEGAARPVAWLMLANPLTYGVWALREALSGNTPAGSPGIFTCFVVSIAFAALMSIVSMLLVRSRAAGDLM